MPRELEAHHGAWTARWSGGRLAEVFHAEYPGQAVECFQVAGYDWVTDTTTGGEADLVMGLREWVRDYGATTQANLRYTL
jgi:hypothetical protein